MMAPNPMSFDDLYPLLSHDITSGMDVSVPILRRANHVIGKVAVVFKLYQVYKNEALFTMSVQYCAFAIHAFGWQVPRA
jgi:hypothetical protein